jgi:hypothetical protein
MLYPVLDGKMAYEAEHRVPEMHLDKRSERAAQGIKF